MNLMHWGHICWRFIRRLSGDDAYERYVAHCRDMHETMLNPPPMLTRREFYRWYQEDKWNGPNRCC
jgi:uncharacterized short protein YbdD (DUF466 family)